MKFSNISKFYNNIISSKMVKIVWNLYLCTILYLRVKIERIFQVIETIIFIKLCQNYKHENVNIWHNSMFVVKFIRFSG